MSTSYRPHVQRTTQTEELFSATDDDFTQTSLEQAAKETFSNTLQGDFDLHQYVQDHPWIAVGLAATAGYLLGKMGDSSPLEPFYASMEATPNQSLHPHKDRRPLYGSDLPR